MNNITLEHRLSKLGEVKRIDDVTFTLKIENREMNILVNPTSRAGDNKYILNENNILQYFRKINEIVEYFKPKQQEEDRFLKDFINSELKAMRDYARGSKFHEIHCYNIIQAEVLTDKINKAKNKWSADWYYNLKDKCYVVECKK